MNKIFTIAETFAGAGGSHLGFKKAGFKNVFINEFDKYALATLIKNNEELLTDSIIESGDLNNLDFEDIGKKLKIKVDVLFGGVVCKGFSQASVQSPADARNYLYLRQLELVEQLKPHISVIENVPALLTAKILKKDIGEEDKNRIEDLFFRLKELHAKKYMDFTPEDYDEYKKNLRKEKKDIIKEYHEKNLFISVFEDIKKRYDELGYTIYHKILEAHYYGCATTRKRLFIVAIKKNFKEEFLFPDPTTLENFVTVKDIFKNIDYHKNDSDIFVQKYNDKTRQRMALIPEGKHLKDILDSVQEELKIRFYGADGGQKRLHRDFPAFTITSNLPLHFCENRQINIREAACLHGFPNNYSFCGSIESRSEQVANSIPIPLAYSLAKSIKNYLLRNLT